jgi:RNA polymerase sigma-70 factor (ECF subfamily)
MARAILRGKVARVWRRLERRRRLETHLSANLRSRTDLSDLDAAARELAAEDHFEHLCTMMTETEKRLIELRLLGYSTAEAAREMGRDPESLRMTLARLRKKLRESGILSDPADHP